MVIFSVALSFHLISMISGVPTKDESVELSDDAWEEQLRESDRERDKETELRLRKMFNVRDAGNFFSRWNCEWVEYLETCDYGEDCSGFFKSQKTNWTLEWTSCNDTIVDQIVEIFPDVDLKFDQIHPKPKYPWAKVSGRRCIPKLWDGPEFCDPIGIPSKKEVFGGSK